MAKESLWIKPYGMPRNRVTVSFQKPSRVKQAFKDECDINRIMSKYQQTGLVQHMNTLEGRFDDVANVTNYHDAMNTIIEAEHAFQMVPAKLRKHFDNDPAKFLEAFYDEENHELFREYGIMKKKAPEPVAPKAEPEPEPAPQPPKAEEGD